MNNVKVLKYKNIYYMVAYCIEELKYFNESLIDYEKLNGTHDLLAELLIRSFEYLQKSNYLKQYNKETVVTDKPKGRIDIEKSLASGSYKQGRLVCDVMNLNIDTELNQIIKSAFLALIDSNRVIEDKINPKLLASLNNYKMMLKGVSTVELNPNILARNYAIPEQYRPIIAVSKLILNDWIAYDFDGKHRLLELNDDERLCRIWEKYLRNLIKRKFTYLKVSKPSYDGGEELKIDEYGEPVYINNQPVYETKHIQPDMEIKNNAIKKIIVGDAKWYTSSTDTNANRNQIRTYSDKCYEQHRKKEKQYEIHGILLYAYDRTDKDPRWKDKSYEHSVKCSTYHININQDKEDMERDIIGILEKIWNDT